MNTNPIDIIADAIHQNGWGLGHNDEDTRAIAASAAEALTDERIIAHATEQLRILGLGEYLSSGMIEHAARTVLRSVAGGA